MARVGKCNTIINSRLWQDSATDQIHLSQRDPVTDGKVESDKNAIIGWAHRRLLCGGVECSLEVCVTVAVV